MRSLRGAAWPRSKGRGRDGLRRSQRHGRFVGAAIGAMLGVALFASPASALKYELADETPIAQMTGGIAIDQSTGNVYVGTNPSAGGVGIARLNSAGEPLTPASMGTVRYMGMGVNPQNQDVYGINDTTENLDTFSSSGSATGTPWALPIHEFSQTKFATDSVGNIYYPNLANGGVDVFTPTGEPIGSTIKCEGCAGFPYSVLVARASNGDLYVAGFDEELEYGATKVDSTGGFLAEVPVADIEMLEVDAGNDNLIVGAGKGEAYHLEVLNPNGEKLTEFGQGTVENTNGSTTGIATNAATGVIYLADGKNDKLWAYAPVLATATTTAAGDVTSLGATLNGTVNPNEGGDIVSCEFEWGTTTEYAGGTVPCATNPGDGGSAVPVTGELAGLAPSTTYHYQLVVDNGAGPVGGGDQQFTTAPPAPTATTEAATGIGLVGATLHATVNANGDDAACAFEYGPTTAYGTTAACSVNPVTGEAGTAVSAVISGLSAGTTYHFRVVAENSGGPAEGSDATFATTAHTCATNAALCPPATGPAPTLPQPPPSRPAVTKKPLKCKKGFRKKRVKGKQKCVKVKKRKKKGRR